LSTSVNPVNLEPAWKQEVNRRVAAHLNRKAPQDGERGAAKGPQLPPASRAAQAAARVAERYAKAPSYSEMLAAEARAAIFAAEAASRAAFEAQVAAQAAAQSVLASLEAAATERAWEPPQSHEFARPQLAEPENESANGTDKREDAAFAIRPESEIPRRGHEQTVMRATYTVAAQPGGLDFGQRGKAEPLPADSASGEIEVVEPAQPIYANLIEFPRPLVAARKVRPRLAEGPLAAAGHAAQLSIFEVDPGAISTEPEASNEVLEADAPAWAEPEWGSIKLDAQPAEEFFPSPLPQAQLEPVSESVLELAPMSRRVLAITVDFALVLAFFAGLGYLIVGHAASLPGLRAVEIGSAVALLVIGSLYESLFLSLAGVTPGMWYAQVRLCTFDDEIPERARRNTRLAALLVSIVPIGLGLMWAIFDDDHLTWHDRLSRTYLRQY